MKHKGLLFCILFVFPHLLKGQTLKVFTFESSSPNINITGRVNTECSTDPFDEEIVENFYGSTENKIVLALTEYSDSCWTNTRYSNGDYLIEIGTVTESGQTNGFSAFRIHPPTSLATQFTASDTVIHFWFTRLGAHTIYSFDGQTFVQLESVTATVSQSFVKTTIRVDNLKAPLLLFATHSDTRVSVWPLVNGIESAIVFQDAIFAVSAQKFDVSGSPFKPATDWNSGPDSWSYRYGTYKRFFPVFKANGDEGVVWQDPDTFSVYLTWIPTKTVKNINTIDLPNTANYILEAAVGNDQGNIAFVLIKSGSNDDKVTPTIVKGIRVDESGSIQAEITYDTSKNGLNVYSFFESGASLAWNTQTDQIGLLISRTMVKGGDGLNHQGCIAVVIDATDMSVIKNLGQTSGHSFGNSLSVGMNGKFLGADLGDNYPRGINLQEFDDNKKKSKLVYKFKTKHSTSETSYGKTWPVYSEISNSKTTYYKQSNDNEVYTELAHNALVELDDVNSLVLFSGEYAPLDNSKVGGSHNTPRNIGFVVVPTDMSNKSVVSQSSTETGGFFNFGGGWSEQVNEGIRWLTHFCNLTDNASRLKAVKISDNKVLVLFEKWTGSDYVSSHLMLLNVNGGDVSYSQSDSTFPFRIPFADEVRSTSAGVAIFYSGETGKLVRYEILVNSDVPQENLSMENLDLENQGDCDKFNNPNNPNNPNYNPNNPNNPNFTSDAHLLRMVDISFVIAFACLFQLFF